MKLNRFVIPYVIVLGLLLTIGISTTSYWKNSFIEVITPKKHTTQLATQREQQIKTIFKTTPTPTPRIILPKNAPADSNQQVITQEVASIVATPTLQPTQNQPQVTIQPTPTSVSIVTPTPDVMVVIPSPTPSVSLEIGGDCLTGLITDCPPNTDAETLPIESTLLPDVRVMLPLHTTL